MPTVAESNRESSFFQAKRQSVPESEKNNNANASKINVSIQNNRLPKPSTSQTTRQIQPKHSNLTSVSGRQKKTNSKPNREVRGHQQ